MHLQVIFGKRDHFLVCWTMSIFGPRSATWNAIPYVHIWWSTPKITDGPVRRLIVVCVRTAYSIRNGYPQIGFKTGASGSQRVIRAKSIVGCEIGHSRAAPVETKPLLR